MKTMTCKQLGGACDEKFQGNTFEEVVQLSKQHGMLMFQAQDAEHLKLMAEVSALMQNPEAMQTWFETKQEEFANLPED